MKKSYEESFWEKVDKTEGCWLWTAAKNGGGYGAFFRKDGRFGTNMAHRIAFQLAYGAIPDGMIIMHTCDNRACVNPAHLVPGTHQDNVDDMVRKGRKWHAFKVPPHGYVKATRRKYGLTQKQAAQIARVSLSSWSAYEQGKRKMRLETWIRFNDLARGQPEWRVEKKIEDQKRRDAARDGGVVQD